VTFKRTGGCKLKQQLQVQFIWNVAGIHVWNLQ